MKTKVFFVITIISLLYWRLWIPEPKVATDFFFWYSESLKSLFSVPLLWREVLVSDGFGQYIAYSLSIWPILLIYGALSWVDFSLLTRLVGILPFVSLGALGIYKLLSYFNIHAWGKFVGTFFYLSNTYILLLLDGGQLYLGLAYAILPLTFLFYKQTIEENTNKAKLFFICSIIAISVFDFRILYFVAILIFLSFIFDTISSQYAVVPNLVSHISLGLLTGITLLFVHLPWILPSVLIKSPSLPVTYDRSQQVEFLSFSSLGHSLLLLQPHWYTNVFGRISELKLEFFLIPILVFFTPILTPKNILVMFWMVVALMSIFLTKGSQEPFPHIYNWLFDHLPGFVLFRDPTKFYFLVALSYSVLLAIFIEVLLNIKSKSHLINKLIKVTPIIVIIYLIVLARPVYLGQMTGLFSSPLYKEHYAELMNFFRSDQKYSRIVYVPHHPPLGYSTPLHPAIDGLYLTNKRPFAIGTVGTYEAINFLRESSFMGEIFDIAGISYIVFPLLDPRRDDMHIDNVKHYYTFINQIANLPWVSADRMLLDMPVLKVREHQDKFFMTANLWWVIGSDNIYIDATKSAKLRLAKNALVFAEETSGLGNKLSEFPEAKIVLNNKNLIDLAATFIDTTKLIFPAQRLDFNPDKSGWWKREAIDLVWWRDFLQSKYGIDNTDFDLGGGWAVAEGNLKLILPDNKLAQGNILLARVMESSQGGQLEFYQEDALIGTIKTTNSERDISKTNVQWFEVGLLPNKGRTLSIASEGSINVVNALAVLDNQEWIGYQRNAEKLRAESRITTFSSENVDLDEANVEYKTVNSTEYKIKISGVSKPMFLVFSQSYDQLWKMGNSNPIPVYSMFNLYRIENNGEYEVYFEAQKYVFPGFVVAIVFILVFLGLLTASWFLKKKSLWTRK